MSRSNVKTMLTVASVAMVVPFAVAGPAQRPAVVTVRVWSAAGVAERATGTVIAPGQVLTVAHVLDGGTRVEVQGRDGVRRRATLLKRGPGLDLALLRVPGATGPSVRFGDADGDGDLRVLTVGDGVVSARVRRRIVARLVDQPGRPRRPSLELAVTVGSGDSGAPVVDAEGDLVGVVYARSTRREGTAYGVRYDALRRFAG